MAIDAQYGSNLIDGLAEQTIARHGHYGEVLRIRIHAAHREIRNKDTIVGVPKKRRCRPHHGPNHFRLVAVNHNFLTNRIDAENSAFYTSAPITATGLRCRILKVGKKTAGGHFDLAGLCVTFFHTAELGLVNGISLEARHDRTVFRPHHRRSDQTRRAFIAEIDCAFIFQIFASAFFRSKIAGSKCRIP